MATIGTWGDLVFSVSRNKVKTFDGLKWEVSARYVKHDRHLKKQLLEFVGTDTESISFTMLFSVLLGTDPMREIENLRSAVLSGDVSRLIIGSKAYGKTKWVITKISNQLTRYDNRGNLLAAKVDVTMESYEAR